MISAQSVHELPSSSCCLRPPPSAPSMWHGYNSMLTTCVHPCVAPSQPVAAGKNRAALFQVEGS